MTAPKPPKPTTLFPNFKAALAATKAGTSRTVINCIGDSTTAGSFGGNPSSGTANNAKAGSYPTQLQALFPSLQGTASGGALNIWGDGTDLGTPTAYQAYDSNSFVTTGVGMYVGNSYPNAGVGPGGAMFQPQSGSTQSVGLFGTYDTVEVYGPTAIGYGSGAALTLCGQIVGTINQNITAGVSSWKFTGTAIAGHGSGIGKNSDATGNSSVQGIIVRNANTKSVDLNNMGWGNSTSADWVTTTHVYNPLSYLPLVPASLAIVNLGINDMLQSLSVSSFTANMQTIISALKALPNMDILLVGFNPLGTATVAQSVQNTFLAAIQSLASSNNLPLFNINSLASFVDEATAATNGLMGTGSTVHPNAAGYGAIAQGIYNYITTN